MEPFIFILTIGVFCFTLSDASCQELIVTGSSRYNDTSGGQVSDLPTKLVTEVSSVYWYKESQPGKIYLLNNDSIINYRLNFRIDVPEVEIYLDEDIKILPIGLVQAIIMDTNKYVTQRYFEESSKLPQGFYEILVNGSYSLVKKLHFKIQTQDYSPQFDVGNTSARAIKTTKYYLINSENAVLDFSEAKKKIVLNFFDNPSRTKDFLKFEKVKFKKDRDLIKWIEYENSFPL
jgi:hypothetical protein